MALGTIDTITTFVCILVTSGTLFYFNTIAILKHGKRVSVLLVAFITIQGTVRPFQTESSCAVVEASSAYELGEGGLRVALHASCVKMTRMNIIMA